MNGSMMVKVSSIVMIVFATIAGFISLTGYLSAMAFTSAFGASAVSGLILLFLIISLLGVGFQIYAGIMGVKYHNSPEHAGKLVTLGYILVGFAALVIVLSIFSNKFNFLNSLISLVLPGVYLYGSMLVKQA